MDYVSGFNSSSRINEEVRFGVQVITLTLECLDEAYVFVSAALLYEWISTETWALTLKSCAHCIALKSKEKGTDRNLIHEVRTNKRSSNCRTLRCETMQEFWLLQPGVALARIRKHQARLFLFNFRSIIYDLATNHLCYVFARSLLRNSIMNFSNR